MASQNLLFCTLILRLVLPLALLPCIIFRPCGLSFLYLLLLLYIPFVPSITLQSYAGHSGKFLRATLVVSFFTVILQIGFQCFLLALPPYGSVLVDCELLERIFRHIGLIKLQQLEFWCLLQWLFPDGLALAVTVGLNLVVSNLIQKVKDENLLEEHTDRNRLHSSPEAKGNKVLSTLGAYGTLALLCLVSSLQPSIPNSLYFLIFMGGATAWALSFRIHTKPFAVVLAILAVPLWAHIISIFLYQLQWSRELLPSESLLARLAGLVPLVTSNCQEGDPREIRVNWEAEWSSFVNPIALAVLYHVIMYEVKLLFSETKPSLHEMMGPGVKRSGTNASTDWHTGSGKLKHSRFSRRQTIRWHPHKSSRRDGTEALIMRKLTHSTSYTDARRHSESTPLISIPGPRSRYGSNARSFSGDGSTALQMQQGSTGGTILPGGVSFSRGQSITSKDSSCPRNSTPLFSPTGEEDAGYYEYNDSSLLFNGLMTLFDLFAGSSYIGTNIIMMAWSITYHSWLTFILLLWACVLWMFPNQRRAMLLSSPGLVLYAELLLIAQYIFSLNLNDDELPREKNGFNFAEIGLVKPNSLPCVPLIVKSTYTLMFWVTLRQFVMEKKNKRAAYEEAAQESFRVTVSATAAGAHMSELHTGDEEDTRKKRGVMEKIGTFLQDVLTKFWIWVVAIMLFVIGLGGEEVVLYRIVYMALFLIFILTFQLSYGAWRRIMFGFWLTVIIYSMLVLVLIYTYQFEDVPQYLSNYTGIPDQLQEDIGLEKYDTGSLFVRLLTPTFFVVITVVQLHYFHKDFLKLSDLSGAGYRKAETSRQVSLVEESPPNLIDEFNMKNLMRCLSYYGARFFIAATKFYINLSEFLWRFLEIHITKIVLFSTLLLTVHEICALHFFLFLGVVCAVAVSSDSIRRILTHFCSIFISILLLAKMIYQIDYISHSYWDTNCTIGEKNMSFNDAEWLGLQKLKNIPDSNLPSLLQGYIGIILVLTLQAVVQIRQRYQRTITKTSDPGVGILFKNVCRDDADKGVISCLQFVANYGFYKFGIEITLIVLVAVIGTRLDIFSVLYSIWLIPMFGMSRAKLSNIWLPFIAFIAVLLPIQYISCVGLPPFLCPDYPWEEWDPKLIAWLTLPDIQNPPQTSKLIVDFLLLLCACQQYLVFGLEKRVNFPGGSNDEILKPVVLPSENPTPDFLTFTKTWLDVGKKCCFLSFYWISLAIIFLTGTNRVNFFALGYLVGSFVFLWEGNEFYLRTKKSIIKRWNYLLAYNVFVIFSKSILQLVGCVFLTSLHTNFCWLIQLFGVACLNKFSGLNSVEINQQILNNASECDVPTDEAGIMWDGITFAFLLIQRRIFNSYYFFHIRAETEVQAQLASRGAELIEELMQKQIKQQEKEEKEVLEKIKMKMDRIKAVHEKGRTKGAQNHFDGGDHGVSSMISSPISLDDTMPMVVEEKSSPSSPLAPLAEAISTKITSGSGPTPTPSSAAMTLSVEGFFEPPYGRSPRDAMLHPPQLPLSSDDDSFPAVFSPPPYPDDPISSRPAHSQHHTTAVQTSPTTGHVNAQYNQRYLLHSPAWSHHTSIRSGDYYMFEDFDDDDIEMIDSITEEEDEDLEESERLPGVTLSELMSSAMKTDVESAAEMARMARRDSIVHEGDFSESTWASRRRSRRKSRRSVRSFRSDKRHSTTLSDGTSAAVPLALRDEEEPIRRYMAGDGGRDPGDSDEDGDFDGGMEGRPSPPTPPPTMLRRILGYIRFSWAVLESVMISMAGWLNKYSKDYRHVSRCLTKEKQVLKEREFHYQPEILQSQPPPPPSPPPPPPPNAPTSESLFMPDNNGIENVFSDQVNVDIETRSVEPKPPSSTEESGGSGDAGSKDDLLTVVEKPSPTKETAQGVLPQAFESMDEISLSNGEEVNESPIVVLAVAIWYVVIAHSELVCYFVIFLNQIKSASMLSLPLPLMVLLWGSLSVPRPTKTFWVTIIAYTEAMVVIKYLFQFDFFPWNDGKAISSGPFWPPKILGIEQKEKYAAYDVLLLMVVFFHRFMLKSLGLWKNKNNNNSEPSESEKEKNGGDMESKLIPENPPPPFGTLIGDSNGDALVEAYKIKDEGKEGSTQLSDEFPSHTPSDSQMEPGMCTQVWQKWHIQEHLNYGPQFLQACVMRYLSSIRLFFQEILNVEYKVKVDVYSWMFACDFFNFMVVIFGFSAFGSQQGDVSSYLEENKVPIPFLVMVILQFALIVIDRALYLRKDIMGKFFFQIALATLVHIAMFFLLPAVTERDFNALVVPQMWYMVKCIYLLFSAYQLRSGYPTRILGNFLCKKYNYLNMFLFKGFMGVPFLFEMRALMDWIWTDTSMTLSDWLKLEDIFANIFQLKCQRRAEKEYPQERGKPKKTWTKYAIGGSSLLTVIAIIWFPLVLFALGNTVGLPSTPFDVSVELAIGSYEPIFTMSAQKASLIPFRENDWNDFTSFFNRDKLGSNFLSNYEHDDIVMAALNGNASAVWAISPPSKQKLVKQLLSDESVTMRLSWSVSRDNTNPNSPTVASIARGKTHEVELEPGSQTRLRLIEMINNTRISNNTDPVTITSIFPKFLKISNSGKATVVTQLNKGLLDNWWSWTLVNATEGDEPPKLKKETVLRNLSLSLQTAGELEWWTIKEDCPANPKERKELPLGDNCQHLNIYTFNEKAFPPTLSFISGGGIIGLYTTFVLVASKFVRGFFAGISYLIMFDDMPNVDRIFQLCLDVYLVRESGELDLEEDLFAKLIFLYRSPETLIKWTRPKTERPVGQIREDGENPST